MTSKNTSSKRVKGATKVARCRVCHRELRDAAAIAAGIGPTCAAKAAAARTRTEALAAGYSPEKYARIQRSVKRLAAMAADESQWTPWAYSLVCHWYARWSRMEREAQRRMTAGARQVKRAS